jgi:hypothetical protein
MRERRVSKAAGAAAILFGAGLLAACGADRQEAGAAQANQQAGTMAGPTAADPTADPATGNLTFDSPPGAVDQAVNQTDRQSGVPGAVDEAANSVQ